MYRVCVWFGQTSSKSIDAVDFSGVCKIFKLLLFQTGKTRKKRKVSYINGFT